MMIVDLKSIPLNFVGSFSHYHSIFAEPGSETRIDKTYQIRRTRAILRKRGFLFLERSRMINSFDNRLMSNSRASKLVAAMNNREFVRIHRKFEDSPIRGYVLGVGAKFFLLLLVSDRIRFDGFECFRIADVVHVQADPYVDFVEAALKKRGLRRPRKPRIDLESAERILLSARKAFPLITIHLEKREPDVCYIGRVFGVGGDRVSLLGIDPHAKWDEEPEKYPLDQITRINFGGDYETALHVVGGDPPVVPQAG
jgi:hypothetical protein